MTQIYTILFDLDGTIVNTAPDLMAAHNHVMKKFGHAEKKLSDIKSLAGKGAWVMMQRSFKEEIQDEKIKKEMTKEFIDYYRKNIVVESKLLNGVLDFLKWSKKNNISLAVCTNKQEHLAIDLLKKINVYNYFDYVAGSNTFDYCKPDPRHITNIIDILQGNIKKSLMIGDSEVDSMAASSADIPFILVEDGYTDKNINQIPHKHLIKDFVGIEKIVSNYLNDNT